MLKHCLLLSCLLLSFFYGSTATRYWVGSSTSNWEDAANWSLVAGGAGGAPVPGADDDVLFGNGNALAVLIKINQPATVRSITVKNSQRINIYTASAVTLRIGGALLVDEGGILKDSTSLDVAFRVVFDGALSAIGDIHGQWIFEGSVPVQTDGSTGPSFTAEPGAAVKVYGKGTASAGSLVIRKHAGHIVSEEASLTFGHGSTFLLEGSTNGFIPRAYWEADQTRTLGQTVTLVERGATIRVSSSMGTIRHLGERVFLSAFYQYFEVDLPLQAQDASLDLPNDFNVKSLLVSNTNNRNLCLLAAADEGAQVYVFCEMFTLAGSTSRVALARASAKDPGENFRLNVNEFAQAGGNFSLQDFDNPTGATVLGVRGDLVQTGGTFFTNSTTTNTSAQFVVEMNGPNYIQSQSGYRDFRNDISMSSGTIDNGRNMVTLRLAQVVPEWLNVTVHYGPVNVKLRTALRVGRLDLETGCVYTTATNLLTVTNTDPATNIRVGDNINSYVNGPLRVLTQSPAPQLLPLGKHPLKPEDVTDNDFTPTYHLDSCVIIPASATASAYQAEYFDNAYDDSIHLAQGLKSVSTAGYWDITKVSGADAAVQLTLQKPLPGAENVNGIVVAHYENGVWNPVPGTVLAPGNAASGRVTSRAVSGFSPFTFGVTLSRALAVHFISFSGAPANGGVQLNWTVAEEVKRFDVLRQDKPIARVEGVTGQRSYRFFDATAPGKETLYRIRATEPDGSVTVSTVLRVDPLLRSGTTFRMSPTLVNNLASFQIQSAVSEKLTLDITDMNGRSVQRTTFAVRPGTTEQVINLSALPGGNYQATAVMTNGERLVTRFVKR